MLRLLLLWSFFVTVFQEFRIIISSLTFSFYKMKVSAVRTICTIIGFIPTERTRFKFIRHGVSSCCFSACHCSTSLKSSLSNLISCSRAASHAASYAAVLALHAAHAAASHAAHAASHAAARAASYATARAAVKSSLLISPRNHFRLASIAAMLRESGSLTKVSAYSAHRQAYS